MKGTIHSLFWLLTPAIKHVRKTRAESTLTIGSVFIEKVLDSV